MLKHLKINLGWHSAKAEMIWSTKR